MRREMVALAVLAVAVGGLAGCGTASPGEPTPETTPASAAVTPTPRFPRYGHDAGYSWIAGQVAFTKIQGGCTYVRIAPAQEMGPGAVNPAPGTPAVGAASRGDTSPPLGDITPIPPGSQGGAAQGPANPNFVPGGPGWDATRVKDGDFVVLFGHVAGPSEPKEICPGGQPYVVDRMELNP